MAGGGIPRAARPGTRSEIAGFVPRRAGADAAPSPPDWPAAGRCRPAWSPDRRSPPPPQHRSARQGTRTRSPPRGRRANVLRDPLPEGDLDRPAGDRQMPLERIEIAELRGLTAGVRPRDPHVAGARQYRPEVDVTVGISDRHRAHRAELGRVPRRPLDLRLL